MKDIGMTHDRQQLVSMSPEEHKAFAYLEEAIRGGQAINVMGFRGEYQLDGLEDMSDVFKAIILFVETKFYVNQLQGMITDLNNILLKSTEGSDQ